MQNYGKPAAFFFLCPPKDYFGYIAARRYRNCSLFVIHHSLFTKLGLRSILHLITIHTCIVACQRGKPGELVEEQKTAVKADILPLPQFSPSGLPLPCPLSPSCQLLLCADTQAKTGYRTGSMDDADSFRTAIGRPYNQSTF